MLIFNNIKIQCQIDRYTAHEQNKGDKVRQFVVSKYYERRFRINSVNDARR